MNIGDYENAVIELFKSGKATEEQWKAMAGAVLNASESEGVDSIDASIPGSQDEN